MTNQPIPTPLSAERLDYLANNVGGDPNNDKHLPGEIIVYREAVRELATELQRVNKELAEVKAIGIVRQQEIESGKNYSTVPPLYVVYDLIERWANADDDYSASTSLFNDTSHDRYAKASEINDEIEEGSAEDCDIKISHHDRFVTFCFTRAGAEDFIEREKHNLNRPRIYVEHVQGRNIEIRKIVKLLGDKEC